MLDEYAEARESTRASYCWPDKWTEVIPDPRLSIAIGAAFRAGLRFDCDHPSAASSLANTLAYLDDDVAMNSFLAAVENLRMDDNRLKYVIKALKASKHPRAPEILRRAAWRFFDFFDRTLASMKKKAARRSLDDVFSVDNYLRSALVAAIDLGGEEAENLADRVLSYRDELTVLGTAIAAAFRLTGKKKLERHLGIAIGYIDAIDNFSGGMLGEGLPSYAHYNFAEATLAFARLHPEDAKIRLRDLIAKPRSSPAVALDIAGGALAGLLPLFPDDVLILDWAERILGNRVRSERVFGALRGIAEGRISQAKQWVRYHLYAGCSSNHIGEHPAIMRAASEALIALGEAAPPPFDETDEFARRVPAEMLPEALLDTGKYHGDAVFKRILKEKIFSPRLLEIGGEVLRDRFRVSGDETGTGALLGNDTRKEGIKTMVALGATALPVLDSLLALPRMAGRDKTTILYAMGIATDASALWKMLANASREEIFSLLDRRPAEWVGRIDLAAAWAFARYGAEARSAIESCLRWRVDLLGECETDSWADEEPQVARLPLLFSHFDGADDPLKELLEKIKSYQAREVWDRVLKRKLVKLAEIPQGTQQLILKDAPRGDSSTRYTCAICIAESVVDVTYKGEDIHLNSVLDYQQNQYEQRSTIPCASPQNATALAECMARSLCSLGFTLLPTGRS